MSADASRAFHENELLRACALGEVSAEAAFDRLFHEYGRTVRAWLSVRVDWAQVDDLAQDVWLIFYSRFRRWRFGTEMESTEARPVLSFLFRTCQFVARGHRRLASVRLTEPRDDARDVASPAGAREMTRRIEAERCLELAASICSEGEIEVLGAKLAGLSANDIAEALGITPSVVDHRYRNALARIRRSLKLAEDGKQNTPRKPGGERG